MADAELRAELASLVGSLAEHARAALLRGEQWAVAGAVGGPGAVRRAAAGGVAGGARVASTAGAGPLR